MSRKTKMLPEAGLSTGGNLAETEIQRVIIESMSLSTMPSVFFPGSFMNRSSFASQQVRVFNLTWAITETEAAGADDSVAVIGAGLAGISIATALQRKGFNVQLFEAKDDFLWLQQDCAIRYINPSINFWHEEKLRSETMLPCLNWKAGSADKVILDVRTQFEREIMPNLPKIRLSSELTKINTRNGKVELCFNGMDEHEEFDVVFVTTGFGVESSVTGTIGGSYWGNNEVAPRGLPTPQRYFVSGVGDGGLIEVLRLAYRSFGFGLLTFRIAQEIDKRQIRNNIESVERTARSIPCLRKQSEYVRKSYQKALVTEKIASMMQRNLRPSSMIYLIDKDRVAFSTRTAPIHRFMLAQAVKLGYVQIVHGELEEHSSGVPSINYPDYDGETGDEVILADKQQPLPGDSVIARHGTKSPLSFLLEEEEINEIRMRQLNLEPFQNSIFFKKDYFE